MKEDQENQKNKKNQKNQENHEENNQPLLENEKKNMKAVEVKEDNKEKDKKDENISDKTKWDCLFGLSLFGRLIFTLYSLHGLFFIYNLIIQFLVAFPSLVYTDIIPKWARIPFFFLYIIYAVNSSNILVIPTFEFFSFPFLFYKEPFAHIISIVLNFKDKKRKYNYEDAKNEYNRYSIGILIGVEIAYIIGLICVYGLNYIFIKDYIKMGILILIYIYYLIICFSYIAFFAYIIGIMLYNCKDICNCRKILNSEFKDREISNLNLFSNIINPFLYKNYTKEHLNENGELELQELNEDEMEDKCLFENGCCKTVIILKIITFIFSLCCFFSILVNLLNSFSDIFFFSLLYLSMTILTMVLNFPFCYRNRRTYGTFGGCCKCCECCESCECCECCVCEKGNNFIKSDIKYTKKISLLPNLVSCSRLISNVVLFIAGFAFSLIYFANIQTDKKQTSFFKGIIPSKEIINHKNLLLPNVCYSSVHNIPLILFLPFINDAYYYGNIVSEKNEKEYKSSLEIEEYIKLFFDEGYEINVKGNLVNKKDTVAMVQYNVKNKKNYLTILAIKGTSITTDMYIDAQLYVSSILLSILFSFSLTTEKESNTFKLIEYSLSIPYRIFFRFLIIDKYMNDLKDAFIENEYSFHNNVVIVGHSLGGGLAKLFGRFIGKQAISLSGPGINAFQSLWKYEKNSENFAISAIDLIPDMDLVPRVEVSGGTIYRIICKMGVGKCHGKELSLCETLIMCRHPIYESLCLKQTNLGQKGINEIKESSELN